MDPDARPRGTEAGPDDFGQLWRHLAGARRRPEGLAEPGQEFVPAAAIPVHDPLDDAFQPGPGGLESERY